ncbi:sensor histidine kinase [Chryseobacterium polytrichastri]|uniref:GHKL domain-containing protein n=1 Tax=Chryseobacterium polytrichastri TaxID=1302687 RepID=A0A1M7BPM0_9FLAO|nr:histidine kinase [Chryseobacterium polytrichastri]SHL56853.1 GHKL domain-containing protein [Chryseobacterium polytrichastri]
MAKPFILKNYIFSIIFWLVFGIAMWINLQANSGLYSALLQTIALLIISFIFTQFLTIKLLPKALKLKKMKRFLIQATLVILLLSLIFSFIFAYIEVDYKTPLPPNFIDHLPILWKGFYLALPASLLINGTTCGIKFYQEHGKIERDHILLQQAHLENQLKLLQDQMNPHVVFNILNHIHILMKTNTELASFLLLKFSDILRYQLYYCNKNQVIFTKDMQYLQDLVEVEKLRWGNELDVKTTWEINNKKTFIAPLLLVPFIENAFKYVCRLPGHKGYIIISCIEKDNLLTFHIENSYSDIATYKKKDGAHGIGLQNVQKRLALQYPDSHTLKIESDNHVYKVSLTLKLSLENDEQ